MSVGSFLEPCNIPDRYRPKGYILGASKKNLLHVFGSEDDDASHYETIKVYLRLKPLHGHHERLVSILLFHIFVYHICVCFVSWLNISSDIMILNKIFTSPFSDPLTFGTLIVSLKIVKYHVLKYFFLIFLMIFKI